MVNVAGSRFAGSRLAGSRLAGSGLPRPLGQPGQNGLKRRGRAQRGQERFDGDRPAGKRQFRLVEQPMERRDRVLRPAP